MVDLCSFRFAFCLLSITGAAGSGIVGGRVVKPHSRPYMASLQMCGTHVCGGFLIREDFVLTAAHCRQSDTMTVVLGAQNISRNEPSQQRIEVDQFFVHPDYNGNFNDDIMILKLKTNAKLNKYVKTVALPRKNAKIPANIQCWVSGWGKTGAAGVSSEVLKEATEQLQFKEECKHVWKEMFNSATMICTKFGKKKEGICQGDSGGPLLCNKIPQGITAFTACADCSDPKFPHVFTKVSFYIPWIQKVMNGPGNEAASSSRLSAQTTMGSRPARNRK